MPSPHAILQRMADQYCRKASGVSQRQIEIRLTDLETVFFVDVAGDRRAQVREGMALEPAFVITVDHATLERLASGDIAPLTAAGRANISEPAPLDFRLPEGEELTPERLADVVEFTLRFFNPTDPEWIPIGEEHARRVHGGHAVDLFCDRGFRSAWYCLHRDEQLNDPQDTDPFPQGLVVLSGSGTATIGGRKLEIRENEAYYIPEHIPHVFANRADEPLTGLWLAWGQGS